MAETQGPTGPDLSGGIGLDQLKEGEPLAGRMGDDAVLLVRRGAQVFAIGATCTHYGGPLGEGRIDGDVVVCPWHHACFSLETGEAVGAPALNPVATWDVAVRDGLVTLGAKREADALSARGRTASGPDSIVIVGAGAAGSAAAEQLRKEGYVGRVVLVDPDTTAPYDRPNLSKDYLAGSAPEEWIPLRASGFHEERGIERVHDRVVGIDRARRTVQLESGASLEYGALLLATGAEPRRLPVPGAERPHVHVLRSLDDCRALIDAVKSARHVAVLGAGFIGMEAAASLRARGLDVTVVAPEDVPLGRVLGAEVGAELRRAHEAAGVKFRLGRTASSIGEHDVTLDDGAQLRADVVLIGAGVAPLVALAESAGLEIDRGVVVDERLRTSDPSIWAAGDIARWPDAHTGERIRVEHWVVAQRQGQAAARSMLGREARFDDVPFFWTRQFDLGVNYVGHASGWDRIDARETTGGGRVFRYLRGERLLAVATINDDAASLAAEFELQRGASPTSAAVNA